MYMYVNMCVCVCWSGAGLGLQMCRSRVDACLESHRCANTFLLPNSATPAYTTPIWLLQTISYTKSYHIL